MKTNICSIVSLVSLLYQRVIAGYLMVKNEEWFVDQVSGSNLRKRRKETEGRNQRILDRNGGNRENGPLLT